MKNFHKNNKNIVSISLNVFFVILIIIHGYLSDWHLLHQGKNLICSDKYDFVNRRFACNDKHTVNKKEYRDLRSRIEDFIDLENKKGNTSLVSVFFRDLESGPTMGINERVDFVPASLLKLPNSLIVLRLQEEGEIDINKQNWLTKKTSQT